MSHEHDNLILDIENLVVRYETEDGIVHALNGIDLQLGYHQTIGLVGETGAGKTTAALAMMRLVPSPPGVVECDKLMVDGRDILNLPTAKMEEVRGKDVSMIFQDPMTALNPVFTVGEQIAESLELHEHLDKKAAMERAKEMLELVGIPGSRANEYPHQFSGGMKQRVVIAIALACNPKLLIADEPTTALDVTIQSKILELIQEIQKKRQLSVIYITHDLGVVAKVADYVNVMYAGKIVESGTVEDVFYDPRHPYTWGLLSAMPDLGTDDERLYTIPGSPPNLLHKVTGDAFAPRNKYALNIDSRLEPPMFKISETHSAATWLLHPKAPKVDMPPELRDRIERMKKEGGIA